MQKIKSFVALCTMSLASAAACAASPAEFVAAGFGGITLGANWVDTANANHLSQVKCVRAPVGGVTDELCLFSFPTSVKVGGKSFQSAAAMLRQGKVVAVSVETRMGDNPEAESTAVLDQLQKEWGNERIEGQGEAFFLSLPITAPRDQAFKVAPVLLATASPVQKQMMVTLGEFQVAQILSEMAKH